MRKFARSATRRENPMPDANAYRSENTFSPSEFIKISAGDKNMKIHRHANSIMARFFRNAVYASKLNKIQKRKEYMRDVGVREDTPNS